MPETGEDTGDAGEPEAGEPEAGEPEAGEPEAGEPEAGEPEAGAEAGEPDDAGIVRVPGAIVDYLFDEAGGESIADQSGVAPSLDLTIANPLNTTWLPGALRIDAATIIESSTTATKIREACVMTDETTIEVWVSTTDFTQAGPARILTVAVNTNTVDLMLGQGTSQRNPNALIAGRVQTTTGNQSAVTTQIDSTIGLGMTPTHVMLVRPSTGEFHLYIDTQVVTSTPGGTFDWSADSRFALANEYEGAVLNRPWIGTFYRATVYCMALTPAQVLQNYLAGP